MMPYPNFVYGSASETTPPRSRGSAAVEHAGELGFAVWHGRPHAGHRVHTHHDVEVNYLLRGWVEYVMGGQRVRLEAGRACLFWATVPHQIVACDEASDMGWIVLPVTWLWRWGLTGAMSAALLEGRVLGDTATEAGDAESLRRWSGMLGKSDERWRQIAQLEIEARFRRMILHGLTPLIEPHRSQAHDPDNQQRDQPDPADERSYAAAPQSTEGGLAAVEAMAAYITSHHAEAIRVSHVAAAVSLHPNYAMRLFRRHMGMTLVEYLTRQRVAEAQRRLMSRDDAVLTVGLDCGFGSASRFHAAFRRCTGTTPHRYRRSLQAGRPPVSEEA
ncbi:MAG: helix-turn-helix domain-containing protein [Phycisphaeraceae bacterium]